MINCTFLPVFFEYHHNRKQGKPLPAFENFSYVENIWMIFYGLGRFETYQFLYMECTDIAHFKEWLTGLKGEKYLLEAAAAFYQWKEGKEEGRAAVNADVTKGTLSAELRQHWEEHGYVRVSGVVDAHLCDAVSELICQHLGTDLSRPETWYSVHENWHGLMLQVYQDDRIAAIRTHPAVKEVFAELYGTDNIVARTEKVSFNPPETESWKFAHGILHWDVDLKEPERYYIQGLVYLNDVPEDRGPLVVVPGFHHRFDDWMQRYPDFQEAHLAMRKEVKAVPVHGKKGDLVLWLQTLPHAASANHSDLPRFVQYVSFSKL